MTARKLLQSQKDIPDDPLKYSLKSVATFNKEHTCRGEMCQIDEKKKIINMKNKKKM